MGESSRAGRRDEITEAKRAIILRAARTIFEQNGVEAASIRAIATAAGYTPGALYGYFPSKEHIYAALLSEALDRLAAAIEDVRHLREPADRFRAAGLAFFDFYDGNPGDLDLGFYLFRGGIRPHGLTADLNADLNAALLECLNPILSAAAALGASDEQARVATADVLAHISGLLLLAHTKRLALLGGDARTMMADYLDLRIAALRAGTH
ncbi:TetR/AcrR family transcriptional regulator [Nocardia thailandica]|uniref:TetR/AcrR family transcriptional regulator n=1 Tax=Nocardia thailandica TaxID=257275 RepID=A0ABW6PV99_9NOCA|nr:TetR/AcrR family transcriptional regulator [Nocardia thailandica]